MAPLAFNGLYSTLDHRCAACGGIIENLSGYVAIRHTEPPFQLLGRVCSRPCAVRVEAEADRLLSDPVAQCYPFGGADGLARLYHGDYE